MSAIRLRLDPYLVDIRVNSIGGTAVHGNSAESNSLLPKSQTRSPPSPHRDTREKQTLGFSFITRYSAFSRRNRRKPVICEDIRALTEGGNFIARDFNFSRREARNFDCFSSPFAQLAPFEGNMLLFTPSVSFVLPRIEYVDSRKQRVEFRVASAPLEFSGLVPSRSPSPSGRFARRTSSSSSQGKPCSSISSGKS